MKLTKVREMEYELLCNDLEKIEDALEKIDINDSNEIRRLNFMKANVLTDIEKIESELVRGNRERKRRYNEIIS